MIMGRYRACLLRIGNSSLRRLVAWITICQGLGYAYIAITGQPMTTSYTRQAQILPLWLWAIMLTGAGLFFLLTVRERQTVIGRGAAVVMVGVLSWAMATFATAGAITVLGQYVPILLVVLAEAVHIGRPQ